MLPYVFNLEIEPRYYPGPMPAERKGAYEKAVEILRSRGLVGNLCVRLDGKIERGHRSGLKIKKASIHIYGRDGPDKEVLGRLRTASFKHPTGTCYALRSPCIQYEDGGIDYIERRRHGLLRRKANFFKDLGSVHSIFFYLKQNAPLFSDY